MEKELLNFLNGDTSAVKLEVIISRDRLQNGKEHLFIRPVNEDENFVLFEKWNTPKKENKTNGRKPKHNGGKKPYIMLMVEEIEKLRLTGVKDIEEIIGCIACLGKYIEWNTGRLIHRRTKLPLQYKDFKQIFTTYSNRRINKIIKLLKDNDLLFGTQQGYFISSDLIKKGKMNRKGPIENGL